jgi:transcriptional regulator with XRE-family HTH domain
MPEEISLQERVRRMVKAKSLKKVMKVTGLGRSTIYNLMAGSRPSLRTLQQLASVMDLPPSLRFVQRVVLPPLPPKS